MCNSISDRNTVTVVAVACSGLNGIAGALGDDNTITCNHLIIHYEFIFP